VSVDGAYRALARLAQLGASTLPPTQLAERALAITLEAVGADGGDLCVVSGYQRHILSSAWPELPRDSGRDPVTGPDPLLEKLFGAGRALDCTDYPSEPVHTLAAQLDYRSCASTPIISAGRPVGVIDCAARKAGAFDEPTLELFTAIGALLGPMLDQALEVTSTPAGELQRNVLELRALQRVSETVARTLDLDEVLGRSLDLALQVAHAPAGVIYLRDDARAIYRRVALRNVPDDMAPLEVPAPGVDRALQISPAQIIDLDVLAETPARAAAQRHGFRRVIMLPLRAEARLVGLLALDFREPMTFVPSTVLTLEAIAGQEAVAIENARVHRLVALRARLAHTLRAFGEQALQPDRDLHRLILDTALALTRSDRGLVSRILLEQNRCRVMAGAGHDERLVGMELPADEPYLAESIASAEPVVVEDTATLDERSAIARVARQQGTASFVLMTMRYRGQPIGQLFAASGEPRRYEAEEIEAMQILATMAADALERTRIQAEADAERRRLDATIEHLPFVIAVMNRRGETLHLNAAGRAFAEQFGAVGTGWQTAIRTIRSFRADGSPVPPDELMIVRAFRGEHPPPTELVVASADNKIRLNVMAVGAPLPSDESGEVQAVVIGFQDVTALRALADAKDRFLRVASHELRSPITSLRATTSLLELDPTAITDPERRATMLQRIKRQVDRLIKLVEQLLDSARLNAAEVPIQPVECDLVELAREAIELATSTAPADRGRVRLEGDAHARGVWDPLRIEQVLVNLIGNALRYSSADSPVRVHVSAGPETVTLAVEDRGIGIPEEQRGQLFSPFFRAPGAVSVHKSGLGLGLHIASEIVKRHGGRVRVESRVGEGSTFTVELPRARD
jgi:signal transduction histidine kinase/GAF domain-containing protein